MQQRLLLQQETIFSEQEPGHRVLRLPRPYTVQQSRVQTPAAAGRAPAGRVQGDRRPDVNSAVFIILRDVFYNCKDIQFIQTSALFICHNDLKVV